MPSQPRLDTPPATAGGILPLAHRPRHGPVRPPLRSEEVPMLLRADRLRRQPTAFKAMTGLTVAEFDELVDDLWGPFRAAERARRARPGRKHAVGAGHPFALAPQEQMLLTV